jgi:hypothetical protein
MKRTRKRRFKLKPPPSVKPNGEGASGPVIPVWPVMKPVRKKAAGEVSRRPRWLQGPPSWLASDFQYKIYRRIYKEIVNTIRPKDVVEWIWVNEAANSQFMAMRFATWQEAMLQFSLAQGVRRAVKNRLRYGAENEDDLEWKAEKMEEQLRPTINSTAIQSESFLSRRVEMDSIHRREVGAQRRRDLSLRQLDQRRSLKQKEAARVSRALMGELKSSESAVTEMESIPRKNGAGAAAELKVARPKELRSTRNGH